MGLGVGIVSDEQVKGPLRVGATVQVRHPDRKENLDATITKIQDCSQYTVGTQLFINCWPIVGFYGIQLYLYIYIKYKMNEI